MRTRSIAFLVACVIAMGICAGCAPVTAVNTSGPAASSAAETPGRYARELFEKVTVTKDIEYGSAVNEEGETEKLLLDVYEPGGDTAPGRPAVIFVHGGGFTSGDKASGIEPLLAERLAKKGYVALSINYRLRANPAADWIGAFRDASDDAYAAFEWLARHRDEYRVDTGHIAFGGHSAGSNIVMELCYSDWSGRAVGKDGVFAVIAMAGPQTIRANPAADDPFCLIIHGKLDETVPYSLSEGLDERLDRTGTPHLMHPLPICTHNFGSAINEVDDMVTSVLYRELTGKDSGIAIRNYEDECRQQMADRIAKNRAIEARTISVTVDGDLGEWPQDGFMAFDGLKDAGDKLPDAADLEASGMVAWDADNPGCLCAAVRVKDDIFQEDESADFWQNDSVELLLDLSDDAAVRPLVQWTVNVNGRDVHVSTGRSGACEVKTVREGNFVTFEIRADIAKAVPELEGFSPQGRTIGVSLGYNDCEGGRRQHQVGITAGDTWTAQNFANLKTH